METKSTTAFSPAVPLPVLIDEYNYEEWAIRVRIYLKSRDLWEGIIEDDEKATAVPAGQKNEREAIKDRRRRDYMALHVIQISCGRHAFSKIRSISTANTAWQTLKKKYLLDTCIIDKNYLRYADLYRAVLRGNWTAAMEFLDSVPEAINKAITYKGETALHIAVTAGHAHLIQKLVDRMSKEDLGIEDGDGYTALMTALVYGRSELLQYLYPLTSDLSTSLNDLVAEKGRKGAIGLTRAIYTRNLDLALDLIRRCPRLTFALDDRGESPLLVLASMRKAFPSGNRLVFWKQWIYYCIRIDPSPLATFETRSNTPRVENVCPACQSNLVTKVRTVPAVVLRLCSAVSSIVDNYFAGIYKQLYEMKKIHIQSKELLSCMCEEISTSLIRTGQLENIGGVCDAINRAVKNGICEFVSAVVKAESIFLENKYRSSRNILMLAILYRQSEIFSHICSLDVKDTLISDRDRNDNNILHMAGMIEDSTRLDQLSNAALQMQNELQWFKEVERIVNPKIKEGINIDGLTARELFTKNHQNMVEKGEKWMKDTASSCTVVGALVVTITFIVAFTVQGGNDQIIAGFPIFLEKKWFMLFIISDALSLFSSSTSVLIFLGILTSRYAEEDFLESLPKKMTTGLSALFLSIATMIMAFSTALLIMLHDQLWITIPLICLAGVPFTFFIWIQFPILKDMIKSTYFPAIINRKM